jgi:hypothetical protein
MVSSLNVEGASERDGLDPDVIVVAAGSSSQGRLDLLGGGGGGGGSVGEELAKLLHVALDAAGKVLKAGLRKGKKEER